MGKLFKLQSVLNYRSILEQEAQQQLAKVLRIQSELLAQVGRQRAELRYLCLDLEQKKEAGLPVSELNLYNVHITMREQQLSALGQRIDEINQKVASSRADLLRTSQDRKMVEKLKEKQGQEHQKELNRKENIMLDEMALQDRSGGLA